MKSDRLAAHILGRFHYTHGACNENGPKYEPKKNTENNDRFSTVRVMKTAQNMRRKTALKTVTVFPFHFSTQDCDPFVEKGLEPPRSENMSTWGIPVCSCAMPEE